MFPTQLHARLAACDFLWNKSVLINAPATWRDLYASGQKLLRQGVDPAEVPRRLGIRAERWLEICGACSLRVVAFDIGQA